MDGFKTTRQIADDLGVGEWQVRRCYELGLLPDAPRFAGKRAVPPQHVPLLVDAMRARGWLSKPEATSK